MYRTIAQQGHIIQLSRNGDQYGDGFTGAETLDRGHRWVYRGDLGAHTRWWWRSYCRQRIIILREDRGPENKRKLEAFADLAAALHDLMALYEASPGRDPHFVDKARSAIAKVSPQTQ